MKLLLVIYHKIPARVKIKQRITELWDYEKFGIPFKRGDRYFYFKNEWIAKSECSLYFKNL